MAMKRSEEGAPTMVADPPDEGHGELEEGPPAQPAAEEAEDDIVYDEEKEARGGRVGDFQTWMNRVQELERLRPEDEIEASKRILTGVCAAQSWLDRAAVVPNDRSLPGARDERWVISRSEMRSLPPALASLMLSTLRTHRALYQELRALEEKREADFRTRRSRVKTRFTPEDERALARVQGQVKEVLAAWGDVFEQALAGTKPTSDVVRVNQAAFEPVLAGALSVLPRIAARAKFATHNGVKEERGDTPGVAITVKEEQTLRELARQGSEADKHLTEHNLRLVVYFANKYAASARTAGMGVQFDDLVAFGYEGLIKASRKYDWTQGTRFSTYASDWIRQGITRGITDTSRMVKLPSYIADFQRKVTRAIPLLTQRYGRPPTEEELAVEVNRQKAVELHRAKVGDERAIPSEDVIASIVERMEDRLSPTDVRTLLEYTQPVVSIDKPVGDDDDQELTVASTIADRHTNTEEDAEKTDLWRIFEEACDRVVQRDNDGEPKREIVRGPDGKPAVDPATGKPQLGEAIRGMEDRKRRILKLRFQHDYTLEMCALDLGITRERVRQLETVALKELMNALDMNELEPYKARWMAVGRPRQPEDGVLASVPVKKKRGRPRKVLVPPSAMGASV